MITATPAKKRVAIAVAALCVLAVVALVAHHVLFGGKVTAREIRPKPVGAVHAVARAFQPTKSYVGTLEPWLAANVGPQFVSAYVTSVDVRPGAVVKRGELLATLDCRETHAARDSVAMEARAIDARQKALAAEAARFQELYAKHFASPNEAQKKAAASASEAAKLQEQKAKLSRTTLEVGDCVLRAPFDGEVATRNVDPGAYVRPGMTIVSLVDRSTVRFTADVPENDFDLVAPDKRLRIVALATKLELSGVIARRAPAADPSTRTVHFEVDLAAAERRIPVGTTGEAKLDVGSPEPATVVPLAAASLRGAKATVFVVEGDVAHARTFAVKGEANGVLYLDEALKPGTEVVTEGRALLNDGDRVEVKLAPDTPAPSDAGSAPAKESKR